VISSTIATTTIQSKSYNNKLIPPLFSSTTLGGICHLRRTTGRLFSTSADVEELEQKIQSKGDEIRQLKADGLDKAALAPHIEELLALKAQLPADEAAAAAEPPKKKQKQPQNQKKKQSPVVAAQANKKPEEMSESELRYSRLAKVEAMRAAGVEPYEYTFHPTHNAVQLASLYEGKLADGEEDESADVAVAGRIMTRRVFGKLAFFTLQDESGTIQLQFDKTRLDESFKVRIKLDL